MWATQRYTARLDRSRFSHRMKQRSDGLNSVVFFDILSDEGFDATIKNLSETYRVQGVRPVLMAGRKLTLIVVNFGYYK